MSIDNRAPIGVFDSGLGGLSVVATIKRLLPNENIIYIGDSSYAPYGTKSVAEVRSLSEAITNRLIAAGAKAIVIACNTATSAAADYLRARYDLPIIGMEPAIKPALVRYPNGKILVLATQMTLNEAKFNRLVDTLQGTAQIVKCPASQLVGIVESGQWTQRAINQQLASYLNGADSQYDAVVLGCTHYVFLKPNINQYFGQRVTLFDGNVGTVNQLKRKLEKCAALNTSTTPGTIKIDNTAGKAMIALSQRILEQYND